jgi:hypothetical protein
MTGPDAKREHSSVTKIAERAADSFSECKSANDASSHEGKNVAAVAFELSVFFLCIFFLDNRDGCGVD